MDIDQLVEQIEQTARYCESQGQYVKINHMLPWIEVYHSEDCQYFFQGEGASDLLAETEQIEVVSEEDYILWISQGW